MQFPKDFLWGTATSSYQIEGAANEDGKGKSIWDVFTHVPGTVKDRSNGDMAIDHYHRFREDIRLMAKMGIRNYRFSISWGRILPNGTGAVNEKGLAFYSELVDCLLENGIRPFCTLYHWDLPYALHLRGGWLSPDMPEWFANYTTIVADALGDRVKDFITINEPQCIIGSGYALGVHAPGLKCPLRDTFEMAHNALRAHGRAVQMLRQYAKQPLTIGYAPTYDDGEYTITDEIEEQLYSYLDAFLEEDDEGEKRMYVPYVFVIRDGKVISAHEGTVESHDAHERQMTDSEKIELTNTYQDMFAEIAC